jgi:hypothetical protein
MEEKTMPYVDQVEDKQKTVYGVDEFTQNLEKRDFEALVLDIRGVPNGAAGVPTNDDVVSGLSEISLRDGQDDKNPPVWIDGNEIMHILRALQMVTKTGINDDDGTTNENNLYNKTALDAVEGKSTIYLPIAQYLSQMDDPLLFMRTRDPRSFFQYGVTDPNSMDYTVEVTFKEGTPKEAIGVMRHVTEVKEDHKIPFPDNMTVKAAIVINSAAWGGNVNRVEVFDGKLSEARYNDRDRMHFIESVEARSKIHYDDDALFISDIMVDSNDGTPGSLELDFDTPDDPVIYFIGITHVAEVKEEPTVKELNSGKATVGMVRVSRFTGRLPTKLKLAVPTLEMPTINLPPGGA